ncbi:exodeoxyribonuclease VII small subunit [Zoogloea sp.]|uniref:exodeoxyribonuclease VII small subunit n=2 Tax=Zoogloea sp. TaxID=49181 RepID=UPI0035B4A04D
MTRSPALGYFYAFPQYAHFRPRMVKKAAPAPSFENAVAELEQIVHDMENGQMPLDQALAAYQRGTQLLRSCQDALNRAEQTIRTLEAEASGTSDEAQS